MRRTTKSILLMTLCTSFTLGALGCSADKSSQHTNAKDETAATQDVEHTESTIEPSTEATSTAVTKEEKNKVTDLYKFDDSKEDNLAALIYLGYGDTEKEENLNSLMQEYNLSQDIFEEIVINKNCEWYAVFPKYVGSTVKVDSMVMTDEGDLVIDTEYAETEKPVLLCCNVSDIIPSSQITVSYQNQEIKWNPFLSLEDGSVAKSERVYTATWK
ncbi:MAG: hypothetical protein IKL07_00255 [Clostridium sp.]|nr:hypothetical protein [Clostridium sp.]